MEKEFFGGNTIKLQGFFLLNRISNLLKSTQFYKKGIDCGNCLFQCTLICTYFTAGTEVVSLSCLFNIVVSPPENIFSSTVAILESMEDIRSYLGIDNNKTLGFVISFTKGLKHMTKTKTIFVCSFLKGNYNLKSNYTSHAEPRKLKRANLKTNYLNRFTL